MLKKKFSLNNENTIYNITLFLSFFWIILTIFKKNFLINFINRNTVGMYLLIFIGLSLSKYYFKNLYYSIPIIFIILILHEIAWYTLYIGFTKDEGEVTNNCYSWFNIYCNNITSKTIKNDDNNTDLSEGLFDNNWNLTDSETYKLKFDTYFKYLKLKPGMKILDIGCGNGHWLHYCKSKGVNGIGITISKNQYEHNIKNGLNIILGDINKGILATINEKFDVITNIGAMEHFSSVSQHPEKRNKILKKYYEQVKNLIDPNSKSKRYLNSYMTTNINYSKYRTPFWYLNIYLIASAFGYGYYDTDKNIDKIYNSKNSKIIIKRDYTEDYRWISVRNINSIGYCNYKFDTNKRIFNFVKDVFTDPSWWQRFLYGYFNSWLWQFGGTNPKPMPENKDTPIRSYIYVTKIDTKNK